MKIEKKNLSLEDFLKDLDLNNLEADMMFSDLEDDDPSESNIAKSVEAEESSNAGGATSFAINDDSLTKANKM